MPSLAKLFQRLLEDLEIRDRVEADVVALELVGVDLEVRVVDDPTAGRDLVYMPNVARVVLPLERVSEQAFLVERDEHVNLVDMRTDGHGGGSDPVIAVLAHDVRVELDVGEDMQAAARQRFGVDLGGRIDASTLRTADDPGQLPAAEFSRHDQR